MSDELKVGERVVADVGEHVEEIGGPRYRHAVVLVELNDGDGKVWVSIQNGPVVRLAPEKVRRSKGGLIALEAIPAGSFVEVDPSSGNIRRFRG
jgi:hypothetical protein